MIAISWSFESFACFIAGFTLDTSLRSVSSRNWNPLLLPTAAVNCYYNLSTAQGSIFKRMLGLIRVTVMWTRGLSCGPQGSSPSLLPLVSSVCFRFAPFVGWVRSVTLSSWIPCLVHVSFPTVALSSLAALLCLCQFPRFTPFGSPGLAVLLFTLWCLQFLHFGFPNAQVLVFFGSPILACRILSF